MPPPRGRAVPLLAGVALAALGSCGGGGSDLPEVDAPTTAAFEVTGTDMAYTPDRVAVAAGNVSVVLRNAGQAYHDVRIEDRPELIVEAGPGGEAADTWELSSGRYRFYCSIPGHREAGMEGVLEVRGD